MWRTNMAQALFIRTLHRATSISSVCMLRVRGVHWLLVCRPRGPLELWAETDGELLARGAAELGPLLHLAPLPLLSDRFHYFLALTADDRCVRMHTVVHAAKMNGQERCCLPLMTPRSWSTKQPRDAALCVGASWHASRLSTIRSSPALLRSPALSCRRVPSHIS